tara:strand:+ start:287 stop:1087 length:801 start_codon:yes stop_codon:yes gene_type:complete
MEYIVTDNSTQFGHDTPHGAKVPHKHPSDGEDSFTTIFTGLAKQLYPTGRAFTMPENSVFENTHKSLNQSMMRLVNDAKNIIETSIPDNELFSESDASFLERKFGLFEKSAIPLEDRMAAILRKMAYPSNIKARQHPNFIQSQLRLSGFDVNIYENRFLEGGEYVQKTPDQVAAVSVANTQHGGDTQHGNGVFHGSANFEVIANSDKPGESYGIGVDANLWATFFIAGDTISSMATVPAEREREFRQLVLKLKPAHTVAYLFVNFN